MIRDNEHGLDGLVDRWCDGRALGWVALRTPPMPYRLLKLAEDYGQSGTGKWMRSIFVSLCQHELPSHADATIDRPVVRPHLVVVSVGDALEPHAAAVTDG